MSKKKNVSSKIPNGRILHTRDKDLYGGNDFEKEDANGLYRMVTVVDSNDEDELAVIKLTTSENGIPLPGYKKGKSKYRHYIITLDRNGKPIKATPANKLSKNEPTFKEGKPKNDIPKHMVNDMKRGALKDTKTGKENRKRLHNLKKRK